MSDFADAAAARMGLDTRTERPDLDEVTETIRTERAARGREPADPSRVRELAALRDQLTAARASDPPARGSADVHRFDLAQALVDLELADGGAGGDALGAAFRVRSATETLDRMDDTP